MSKPGLAFGLNLKKGGLSKPGKSARAKPLFGNDDSDDDDDSNNGPKVEHIGGEVVSFDSGFTEAETKRSSKRQNGLSKEPPKLKAKSGTNTMFGDLSSNLTSKKNAEAAAQVDANVYEYDNVYDTFKPTKLAKPEDIERKPKYMRNLLDAAEVRKRDALIAEEKKIAREREAEGEEYEGKEKFVTEAYKKQQEENKRIEEEEKKREEAEAKKNEGGGMSAFYRQLLEKDQQRNTEAIKAAEELAKRGPITENEAEEDEDDTEKKDTARAQELNAKGAAVEINDEGQVVDKRQLLKGGLNVTLKKKPSIPQETQKPVEREKKDEYKSNQFGRKQAMRERQSRMLEEQLEQSLKRSLDEETAQRQDVERESKSRKTEGEISSAKERYLARKRAAEEAKKGQNGAS